MRLAIFLLITSLIYFTGANHAARALADDPSGPAYAKLERETFVLINRYRAAEGLTVLKWDDAIADVARIHSGDMASGKVDFGHDGFGDRMHRLKSIFVGMKGGAENVFMSDSPEGVAQAAVATWLASPHHLENIRGDYTHSGLGIEVNDQGKIYFTQLFLKIEKEASPPPD